MAPSGSDYLSTEVMTATPQKLQLMLVEAALRTASQARQHWASGQPEAASQALIRSQGIMAELLSALDASSPDPLVRRVVGVYLFVYRSLVRANLERSESHLSDALRVLEVERDTWRSVCGQLGSRNELELAVGGTSFEA